MLDTDVPYRPEDSKTISKLHYINQYSNDKQIYHEILPSIGVLTVWKRIKKITYMSNKHNEDNEQRAIERGILYPQIDVL